MTPAATVAAPATPTCARNVRLLGCKMGASFRWEYQGRVFYTGGWSVGRKNEPRIFADKRRSFRVYPRNPRPGFRASCLCPCRHRRCRVKTAGLWVRAPAWVVPAQGVVAAAVVAHFLPELVLFEPVAVAAAAEQFRVAAAVEAPQLAPPAPAVARV